MQQSVLVLDIGGTNSRYWLLDANANTLAQGQYLNQQFANINALFDQLWLQLGPQQQVALAIACPVLGDVVQMTNLHWHFSQRELSAQFSIDVLLVLNDFAAAALGAPHCQQQPIKGGNSDSQTPTLVLGPGTGLGVAMLLANRQQVVATEGGHIAFAPQNEFEQQLWALAQQRFGRVSIERLLSGAGLELISEVYNQQHHTNLPLAAPQIGELALGGDAAASAVVECFFRLLARSAGDLVLAQGARGGVLVAGGISAKLLPLLDKSAFSAEFAAKGRLSAYLQQVPIAAVVDENPAKLGAFYALQTQVKR